MSKLTITEALAEIKTIAKRIEKKQEFVTSALYRSEAFKDPHEKDGGSGAVIAKERQGITDLEDRAVRLREAIGRANEEKRLTVEGEERSIGNWLRWRREVVPNRKRFLTGIANSIERVRREAASKQLAVNVAGETKPNDVRIFVDEKALHDEIEHMETVLGTLDGQLSLANATVLIEVE